jgi:hypothetical protein
MTRRPRRQLVPKAVVIAFLPLYFFIVLKGMIGMQEGKKRVNDFNAVQKIMVY